MDPLAAQEFFNQLTEYSRRLLEKMKLPGQSPWGGETMATPPKGAILHYTADSDMQRVLRWFCDPALGSHASAHVVVGDRRYPWAQGLDEGLGYIQQLPVTVVQTRLPSQVAWHATWTNQIAYGVELVNVGEVRKRDGDWVWWVPRDKSAPEWTSPWHAGDKTPAALFNKYWEPYTPAQLNATVQVLQAVHARGRNCLQRGWVVGHECVQGRHTLGAGGHDKRDPGHAFPVHAVREALFGATVVPDAAADGRYGNAWRQQSATMALGACGQGAQGDAVAALAKAAQGLATGPTPRVLAKGLLHLLGYYMADVTQAFMTPDETASVYLFQRMAGLTADGQLGPQTYDELALRFADRIAI